MALIVATLVVREDQVLLVQENAPGSPWYLPAGRVEPSEGLIQAAGRECLEEAGVCVNITELLGVQQRWPNGRPWTRFIFRGEPLPGERPRAIANEHTLGAAWHRLDAVENLTLRANDIFGMLALADTTGISASHCEFIADA